MEPGQKLYEAFVKGIEASNELEAIKLADWNDVPNWLKKCWVADERKQDEKQKKINMLSGSNGVKTDGDPTEGEVFTA